MADNLSSDSKNQDFHNRGGLLAFGFSIAFVLSFFIYLVAISDGVIDDENVRDPNAKKVAGPEFNIDTVTEPWVSSEAIVTYGAQVFKTNCSACHGSEGKGDGPAAAAMNPKPRNMVEGKWTRGEGILNHFKVLAEGIPGTSMAPFASIKVSDRWAMLHFIESITNNKSKDTAEQVASFGKTAK